MENLKRIGIDIVSGKEFGWGHYARRGEIGVNGVSQEDFPYYGYDLRDKPTNLVWIKAKRSRGETTRILGYHMGEEPIYIVFRDGTGHFSTKTLDSLKKNKNENREKIDGLLALIEVLEFTSGDDISGAMAIAEEHYLNSELYEEMRQR